MIKVDLKGNVKELEAGVTAAEVAKSIGMGLYKSACAARIDGEVCDLRTPLTKDCSLEILTFDDPDGKHAFWHTAAHVMAQAVQHLFPEAKFGIGPALENGWYYDIKVGRSLSTADFEAIETEMKKLVKADEPIVRRTITVEEGREIFAGQDYKLELMEEYAAKGWELSIYTQGDFTDLCAGPHLMSTGMLKAVKLTKVAAAYWRADASRDSLDRLYGIAFPKASMLEEHLKMLEEAAKRDHRKLGKELGLFAFRDEAPGFPFYLPKGMVLKNTLIDYWRQVHKKWDYVEISTPQIMRRTLWETSGHWDHYKDNMYATRIDDEDYCIKPMNCPGGVMVYRSQPHSYRELPMRVGELGIVHRHELKGALHGLFRVRCFTQDDAHIFMTREQIPDEIAGVVHLINQVYSKFGFDYFVELSTRPENSMGSDEDWEDATNGLKAALERLNMPYILNEGDGAFYGPKIDFHLRDSLGRTWQCGTIQLDFQMPLNFGLEYVAEDGTKKRPIMIHRVCFGSIERFIGILTEHFAGKFPTWLAPVQVKVLPVSDKSLDYSRKVFEALKNAGVRVELDDRNEKIGYKIRSARQIDRVPYMLILGEKEITDNTVSVRDRATDQTETMSLDAFMTKLDKEVKERI